MSGVLEFVSGYVPLTMAVAGLAGFVIGVALDKVRKAHLGIATSIVVWLITSLASVAIKNAYIAAPFTYASFASMIATVFIALGAILNSMTETKSELEKYKQVLSQLLHEKNK